jgi:uncharacterized protein (TIGR01777 family)
MTSKGKVLVAGGSGLIGTALTEELVGAGYDVVILSRSPGEVGSLPAGARALPWDGETVGAWASEVESARAVVNLSGAGIADRPWSAERRRVLTVSRIEPTKAVVQAIERAAGTAAVPPALLQGSAVGYYGSTGDRVVDEESPKGTGFLSDLTAAWEEASAPVEATGARRVLMRSGVVLSAEGGALPKMSLPFKMFAGGPIGEGGQWVPWIHVRDEVRAIRFLLEHGEASGPFNLASPEPATNRQLAHLMGKVLHRPSLLRAPAFAVRTLLGKMANTILEGQRALPKRLANLGFTWEYPELERALDDLL